MGRYFGDLLILALAALLLAAVGFLPPDTSFAEVRRTGVLRACVPTEYPPLVYNRAEDPGFDIEILQAITADLGLRLSFDRNPAIGRDFNPRNWGVNRGRCQIVAGGVAETTLTRSFMETSMRHAETGWSIVIPGPVTEVPRFEGLNVGVFASAAGLDRLALSRYLAEHGNTAANRDIVNNAGQLEAALQSGEVDVAVTESLLAATIAGDNEGWTVLELPAELGRYPVVFALWKGDLTLQRQLEAAFRRLQDSGQLAEIAERYFGDAAEEAITVDVEGLVEEGDVVVEEVVPPAAP